MAWDTWAYQDGVLARMGRHDTYQKEHRWRLKRGQDNGSQDMVDMIEGEKLLLKSLLGGAVWSTPEAVLGRLEELQVNPPEFGPHGASADSVQAGWDSALRHEMSSIRRILEQQEG